MIGPFSFFGIFVEWAASLNMNPITSIRYSLSSGIGAPFYTINKNGVVNT